jgi:hypothetical protein
MHGVVLLSVLLIVLLVVQLQPNTEIELLLPREEETDISTTRLFFLV